jgi:hypothetical protein
MLVHCTACSRELRVPDTLVGLNVRCPVCRHIFVAANSGEAPPAPPPSESEAPPAPPASGDLASTPLDSSPSPPDDAPPSLGAPAYLPPAPVDPDVVVCPACGTRNPRQLASCHECSYNLRRDDDEDDRGRRDDRRDDRGRDRDRGRRRGRDRDDDRPWEDGDIRRDWEPHRGTLILVLGALSLVLLTTFYFAFLSLPVGLAAWILGAIDLKKIRAGEMDPAGKSNTMAGYVSGIVGTILGGVCGIACGGFIIAMVAAGGGGRPVPVQTAPAGPTRRFSLTEGPPARLQDYLPAAAPRTPGGR